MADSVVKRPVLPVKSIGYASDSTLSDVFYDQIEQLPELRWPLSVKVFDQMARTDAKIGSVLRAISLPIRRTAWRIDPNGAPDEAVSLISQDLGLPIVGQDPPSERRKGRFSFSDHLRQSLLMLRFGHMYFEQVYSVDDAGYFRLRKLEPRMPRTISSISVARDGGLNWIEQCGIGTTDSGAVRIPVDRLVAYVHDAEAGDWIGTSLLRSAYTDWLIKKRMVRVQAQTIERNGMAVPIYEGSEGGDQDELDRGEEIARAYRSGDTSGGSIPYGAKLNLLGVSGNIPIALPVINYHDDQIGAAVLANFLNLGKSSGSWALGTTFQDFFVMSLQTEADGVADVFNMHVIEDLIDANFGPNVPAPRLVFDEIGSRHDAIADALKTLVDAGLLVPDASVQAAVRQSYGLPAASDVPASAVPEPAPTPDGG